MEKYLSKLPSKEKEVHRKLHSQGSAPIIDQPLPVMEDKVLEQTPPIPAMEDHEVLEQTPPIEDILKFYFCSPQVQKHGVKDPKMGYVPIVLLFLFDLRYKFPLNLEAYLKIMDHNIMAAFVFYQLSTFALYALSHPFTVLVSTIFLIVLAKMYVVSRRADIFLVDFSCYKPIDALKCSHDTFIERSSLLGIFSEESLVFQRTILEKSGLGQSTYFPEAMWGLPPNPCMALAMTEIETVFFGAIDELLAKTGVKGSDIGILVVNSSLFNPVPSLCTLIINHYKMRNNILSYNLGGMGCSAGLISLDLAKRLLQVHPNSYALIVSTENITLNWYFGNKRSMLVSNCLFRMGAGAVLLSNRRADKHRAKYQLIHTVRTHKGNDDRGYKCAYQEEDLIGKVGVTLSKDLSTVAGEALKINLTTLGPFVLPMSERIQFFSNYVARKVLKMQIKPYMPDFRQAFEHFCIHAGGRAVLDKVERSLELSEKDLEPSRMTLYRFGNTSSSSLWYELAYSEAKGNIKRGHRVCQIAFGSGFKCNSAVWRAMRTIDPKKEKNPWVDEIDSFPFEISKS
ncbi:hypothetical protein GIB67_008544 [Kingdonia uniflora]|uniref:very-long-chain 3-oxoacyl-CoA synthase n=1 Tax=Kingdonia uniflora TaxID=39325 RepID=A0A7J7N3S7_9MAGN|nr:hypothetical protein GIB67_008544 [Kingdonia uniflora]